MSPHVAIMLSEMVAGNTPGHTAFSRLSEEAQQLIVNSLLGMYDQFGPPEMSESVRAEIVAWVKIDESA